MRELLDDIDRWRTAGKPVAIARVVDIEGSGPREPGAAMAVNIDGEVAGTRPRPAGAWARSPEASEESLRTAKPSRGSSRSATATTTPSLSG